MSMRDYPLPPGPYPDGLPAPDPRAWLAANRIADTFRPGFFDDRMVLDTARTIEQALHPFTGERA